VKKEGDGVKQREIDFSCKHLAFLKLCPAVGVDVGEIVSKRRCQYYSFVPC